MHNIPRTPESEATMDVLFRASRDREWHNVRVAGANRKIAENKKPLSNTIARNTSSGALRPRPQAQHFSD
jgi:hypothetical protein